MDPAGQRCEDPLLSEFIAEAGKSTLRDCAYVYRGTFPVWYADYLGAIVSGGDAPRRHVDYADWGVLRDYVHELSVKAELLSMEGVLLAWSGIRPRMHCQTVFNSITIYCIPKTLVAFR